MIQLVQLFAGIFLFALGVVAFIGTGQWILGPVDRAAKARNLPMRFSLGDFLCLFIAVQIPLAAVLQIDRYEVRTVFWPLLGITWVVAPLIWFACARALSKAGVTNGKHRLVFMGLVLPLVYYAIIPFACYTIVGIVMLWSDPLQLLQHPLPLVGWFAAAALLYASGLFSRWMIRAAAVPAADSPYDAEDGSFTAG